MAQRAAHIRLVDFQPLAVWLLEQVLKRRPEDPMACMERLLEDKIKAITHIEPNYPSTDSAPKLYN